MMKLMMMVSIQNSNHKKQLLKLTIMLVINNTNKLIEFKKELILIINTLTTIKDKLNYKILTKTLLDH